MDDQSEDPWVGNQWIDQLSAARRRTEEVIDELESSRRQASELIAGLARERAHAARIAAKLSDERALVGLALRRMSELAHSGVMDPRARDAAGVDANEMFGRLAFAENRLERLQASLASATSLLDAVPVPVFSIDSDCRYTAFNAAQSEAVEQLYGERICLGVSIFEYMRSPQDREDAKALYDRCLGGDAFLVSSWRGEGASRRHFTVSYTPMRSEAGVVEGATVVAVDTTADVTLRERATAAMSETLDALGVPAYALDGMLRYVWVNEAWARTCEDTYGERPVAGDSFVFGKEDAAVDATVREEFQRALSGETVRSTASRGSGHASRQWAFARIPIMEDGLAQGIVSLGIDVTDETTAP